MAKRPLKAVPVKVSRVVGKRGPKIEEAKAKAKRVKVTAVAPPIQPYLILSQETMNRIRKLCEDRDVTCDTLISVALRSLESNRGRHYDLETPMGFGKYAAETFGVVVALDPNYIRWILEQQKGITLTDRAQELFDNWMHGG
jgi:hypothetical protein